MRAFLLALALLAVAPPAGAIPKRVCVRSCGAVIAAECEGLVRKPRQRCRAALIRRCRRQGTAVCATTTTTTPGSSTTTTTLPAANCGQTQKNCGTFCCDAADAVCAQNGEPYCCAPAFPLFCPDVGHGRYCCQAGHVCGANGGCKLP